MAAISIALTTFNGADFLAAQLESLASQTLLPAELVVGDDGSSDDTPAIIDAFRKRAPFPVHVLESGAQLGVADNFFRVASACTQPLVAFCDQDDVWLPDKLATSAARMTQDGSVLALHTNLMVDANLAPIGVHRQDISGDSVAEPLERDIGIGCWGNTMMFRRSLLDAADWRKRPTQIWHDAPMLHDSWIYVLACALGRVSLIDTPLCLYRQHGQNFAGGLRRGNLWQTLTRMPYAPLYHYRLCAAFYRDMIPIFESIDHPDHAAAAPAAARAFAQRAQEMELRIGCYDCTSLPARLRHFSRRRRAIRRRDSGDDRLWTDMLVGVLRLGKIDDRQA